MCCHNFLNTVIKNNSMNKTADSWNNRYSSVEYVYGVDPNVYLKEQLEKLPVGHILFAGEGEGRNAVYAAKLGWKVSAFDMSSEGKRKAQLLALKNNVHFDYYVGELHEMNYENEQFDVIALIFTHFPQEIRLSIHKMLINHLRPGGTIILEAFSKNHIGYQAVNPNAGGPKSFNVLYTVEDIKHDFENFEIIELNETEVYLKEGSHHDGLSSVIRFIGKKKGTPSKLIDNYYR